MNKIIKDCFTGSDNETYSLLRIAFAVVQIVYLILCICTCYAEHNFKMIDFGTGEAAILAAFGSALWLSKDTQPTNQKSSSIQ
jgi:hypothetical protein